jgi:hypothetical protein
MTQYRSFNYGHNDVGIMGQPGSVPPDYNTGAATSGTLTSPVIAPIVAATQVLLRFRQFAVIEAGAVKDLPSVIVRTNPGGVPLVTLNKASLGLAATGNTGGLWVTITSDITAFVVGAGAFTVEFFFDSVDALANTTEGWYVDDIEVQVIP